MAGYLQWIEVLAEGIINTATTYSPDELKTLFKKLENKQKQVLRRLKEKI